jgi:hypothetical protein
MAAGRKAASSLHSSACLLRPRNYLIIFPELTIDTSNRFWSCLTCAWSAETSGWRIWLSCCRPFVSLGIRAFRVKGRRVVPKFDLTRAATKRLMLGRTEKTLCTSLGKTKALQFKSADLVKWVNPPSEAKLNCCNCFSSPGASVGFSSLHSRQHRCSGRSSSLR